MLSKVVTALKAGGKGAMRREKITGRRCETVTGQKHSSGSDGLAAAKTEAQV
jgi:hypothetical protein